MAPVRKEQGRPSWVRALDGRAEAKLIPPARSTPPGGRKGGTIRLPAGEPVEPEVVPSISDETARRPPEGANWSRT